MSKAKVLFTFKNFEGDIEIESVWATKQGEYYRIDNIPFLAPNIAFGDVVSVENDEGELHFDDIVQPSGHSTVQLVLLDNSDLKNVTKTIEDLGCSWEGSHLPRMISIDIPKEVDYRIVKKYLDSGEMDNKWSYRESCLAHNY